MTAARLTVLLLLTALGAPARATPAPEDPASAPDAADVAELLRDQTEGARRTADLTRRAIALIDQKQWAQAETVLVEALGVAADDPVNLYNLACARAQLGKADAAIDCLERAAAGGFSDFGHVERDPDLAPLNDLPRFKRLLADREELARIAADRVVANLRERFGDDYLYEVDPGLKLIYATNVGEETLAELKRSLAAQARGLARDLFPHGPEAYVSVVVPSAADYRKIMRFRNVGGIYFHVTRTLIAQRPGDVMRHEFTHALHAADVAPLGQSHAAWVVEGLGVLYESADTSGDGMVPHAENARLPAAQAAARRRTHVPLRTFVAMSQGEFMKRPNITYAQAGSVMVFLRERGWLRPFYDTYKKTFGADPTGRTALEQATGLALDAFEEAWVKWLTDRPAAPFFGAPALFLGARLAPSEGGLTVISLAPNGPLVEAGIEPRDVILALGGRPVSDYASLRPALGAYTPGKTVVVRIRRGGEERDVSVKLAHLGGTPRQLAPR